MPAGPVSICYLSLLSLFVFLCKTCLQPPPLFNSTLMEEEEEVGLTTTSPRGQ